MLQLANIRKTFNHSDRISNADFLFETGQVYSLLGPHGSGKTLLCECIAGLCKPDSGRVYITDGRGAMLIYEAALFPPYLTLGEYLSFLCDEETAHAVCDRVGIAELEQNHLLRDCPLEVRQRLQVAVALIKEPYVLTLDAPFDYCSDEFYEDILTILDEYAQDHIVIITSGSLSVARSINEDVIVLNNGELNLVTNDSFNIPEILQAVEELLSEGVDDDIN